MYRRLCTVRLTEVGCIHSLLRSCGLLPLTRRLSANTAGDGRCFSIELPEDEIETGRKILAHRKKQGVIGGQ